jgi:hypothetical protein
MIDLLNRPRHDTPSWELEYTAGKLHVNEEAFRHFEYTDREWREIEAVHPGGRVEIAGYSWRSERISIRAYLSGAAARYRSNRLESAPDLGLRRQQEIGAIRKALHILVDAASCPPSAEDTLHLAWLQSEIEWREHYVAEIAARPPPSGRSKGVANLRRYLGELLWYWHFVLDQPVTTTYREGAGASGRVIDFFRACALPVVSTRDRRSITPDAIRQFLRRINGGAPLDVHNVASADPPPPPSIKYLARTLGFPPDKLDRVLRDRFSPAGMEGLLKTAIRIVIDDGL